MIYLMMFHSKLEVEEKGVESTPFMGPMKKELKHWFLMSFFSGKSGKSSSDSSDTESLKHTKTASYDRTMEIQSYTLAI